LEIKAGLLAELRKFLNQERIDCEELVRTLERNYFKIIGEAINNLVDEIEKNKQIPQMLGVEAVKELIEKIQNLLYLDPEEDGDLINKLEAELNQKNLYKLETPLRFIAYCQLALISDGGKKLEQFKRRVEEVLERNDYEELKGLVQEISDELKRSVNYQAILILDGGNKLEQFKRRVEEVLERNDYEELKGLVQKISALEIMQVYPDQSSLLLSEREACELKAEYGKLKRGIEEALRKLRPST